MIRRLSPTIIRSVPTRGGSLVLIGARKFVAALAGFTLVFAFVPMPDAGAGSVGSQYRVQLDAQPPSEPWTFLRFFPRSLDVHQGDVVDAAWGGVGTPHTATVVPSGNAEAWRAQNQGPDRPQDPSVYPYAVQVPDPLVGGDDNQVDLNPAVAAPTNPACGTLGSPCVFNGSSVVSSGFQFSIPGSQPSFFVDVTAPLGQYAFVCLVHPGMQLSLNVVSSGTAIPSPSAVATKVLRQVHHARTVDGPIADGLAQSLVKHRLRNGHHRFTMWAGGFWNQVSADEYRDDGLRVNVGDQIRFLGNFEIHTATFPKSAASSVPLITTQCEVSGDDTPANSPADCVSPADFQIAFNSKAVLPTVNRRLTSPSRFVNSGIIPYTNTHTFVAAKPGIYRVVCLVHGPSMSMKITVS
jgi:plastocyanin